MSFRKVLSIILSLTIIVGLFVTPVSADAEDITVFVNVSKYGEFVKDKSGNDVIMAPVLLSGSEEYNLNDVFTLLHNTYYGDDGYSSETGDWGLYITKFWGDVSGNFGYQINRGQESVMGLSHKVKSGDIIDVAIYKSFYPDTESYSCFDTSERKICVNQSCELALTNAGYDENYNMVFSPCEDAKIIVNGKETEITTDKDGKFMVSFDALGTYVLSAKKEKTVNEALVPAITAPICVLTVIDYPDAYIEIPSGAELYVGEKGKIHFTEFIKIKPVTKITEGNTDKHYFELKDDSTYNFRVSGEGFVTYAGTFKKTADFSFTVTEDMLKPEGKSSGTIDRDTSSNKGCNVADIFLNINPEGHLKLKAGDSFQIVSLRNWEAVNSTTSNYFIEPDYNYEVIDFEGNKSDVAEVDAKGCLTAKKCGTAVVLVTYDAMTLNFGSGDDFYGAIYPENTGVFVVSVDKSHHIKTGTTINEGKNKDTIKLSGDYLDAEHDCIYFTEDKGSYTFTPDESDVKVCVANPVVEDRLSYNGFTEVFENPDGSFSVPLTEGRNIIKLEKGGNEEYQVVTAKKVSITVNGGAEVHRGDTVNIVFDKLYHPANKLAGVYNMNAIAVYTKISGFEGKIAGAASAQYNFADSTEAKSVCNIVKEKDVWGAVNYVKDTELKIPDDYPYDTFTLSGGMLYASGWGDSYGNHRGITYENGKAPNLNADAKMGFFGKLPDIKIPITLKNNTGSGGTVTDEISVYFTLLGDEKHGNPTDGSLIHTNKKGTLITWIPKTKITVKRGSLVIDAIKKALDLNGIPYTTEDNYISGINGLSEFDNGSLSGWMYMLNGKYPTKGVNEQTLSAGDNIVFHYTDDYTAEKTVVSSGGSSGGSSSAAKTEMGIDIEDTAEYLVKTVDNPSVSAVGGEWTVIGLARYENSDCSQLFEKYYENIKNQLKSQNGVLHERKNTEYSRAVLALTAIGKNPENVGGYNLITPLLDYEKTAGQGINGSIWALIALDCGGYGTEEIRELYIADILGKEKINGGWSLSDADSSPDADITAMAVTALCRYKNRKDVKESLEKAIDLLSSMQNKDGGYGSAALETSESAAQVLMAISAAGISYKDSRFVKNGKTVVDNILSFKNKDGSFSHTDSSNLMATEQSFYALVAAKRLEDNRLAIFDMSDVLVSSSESAGLSGKSLDVNMPRIIYPGKNFKDVIGHSAEESIKALTERGIISGMSEDVFAPDKTMTRAELATIIVRALGLPVKNQSSFMDVPSNAWYAEYVNTAFNYGIVSGMTDTEFNPEGTITREQAAAMIERAARLCGMEYEADDNVIRNTLAEFLDYTSVSHWAKMSVAFCFDKNILDRNVLEIKPLENVKRYEFADMLYKMLKGAELL